MFIIIIVYNARHLQGYCMRPQAAHTILQDMHSFQRGIADKLE